MELKTASPVLQKIKKLNPSFTISAHREKALDGRNGMGNGYLLVVSDGKAFHVAPYNNSRANGDKPVKAEDALGCLVSDAMAYLSNNEIDEFYNEFGYDSVTKALEAFESCKKTAKALQAMFPDGKLEKVSKILYEAGY